MKITRMKYEFLALSQIQFEIVRVMSNVSNVNEWMNNRVNERKNVDKH